MTEVWACAGCGRVGRSEHDLLRQGCEGRPEPFVRAGLLTLLLDAVENHRLEWDEPWREEPPHDEPLRGVWRQDQSLYDAASRIREQLTMGDAMQVSKDHAVAERDR
jgi:hypothetical protein